MIPNKPEHADKTMTISGVDPRITLRRRLVGYAYPRNGNVHNPTPEYLWYLMAGDYVLDLSPLKRTMVESARTNGAAYLAEVS